jgi:hypothetical protein
MEAGKRSGIALEKAYQFMLWLMPTMLDLMTQRGLCPHLERQRLIEPRASKG